MKTPTGTTEPSLCWAPLTSFQYLLYVFQCTENFS